MAEEGERMKEALPTTGSVLACNTLLNLIGQGLPLFVKEMQYNVLLRLTGQWAVYKVGDKIVIE